jgi:hypothetical protein
MTSRTGPLAAASPCGVAPSARSRQLSRCRAWHQYRSRAASLLDPMPSGQGRDRNRRLGSLSSRHPLPPVLQLPPASSRGRRAADVPAPARGSTTPRARHATRSFCSASLRRRNEEGCGTEDATVRGAVVHRSTGHAHGRRRGSAGLPIWITINTAAGARRRWRRCGLLLDLESALAQCGLYIWCRGAARSSCLTWRRGPHGVEHFWSELLLLPQPWHLDEAINTYMLMP